MIEFFIIENNKSVVRIFKNSNFNRFVLGIVFFQIEFQLLSDPFSVNGTGNFSVSF